MPPLRSVPVGVAAMNARDMALRALQKAQSESLQLAVSFDERRLEALVPSTSRSELLHRVGLILRGRRQVLVSDCSCEARVVPCIHQAAVGLFLFAVEGGWTMELASEPPADVLIDAVLRRIRVPAALMEGVAA